MTRRHEREAICPKCTSTTAGFRRPVKRPTPHRYSFFEQAWYCTRCGDRHTLAVGEPA